MLIRFIFLFLLSTNFVLSSENKMCDNSMELILSDKQIEQYVENEITKARNYLKEAERITRSSFKSSIIEKEKELLKKARDNFILSSNVYTLLYNTLIKNSLENKRLKEIRRKILLIALYNESSIEELEKLVLKLNFENPLKEIKLVMEDERTFDKLNKTTNGIENSRKRKEKLDILIEKAKKAEGKTEIYQDLNKAELQKLFSKLFNNFQLFQNEIEDNAKLLAEQHVALDSLLARENFNQQEYKKAIELSIKSNDLETLKKSMRAAKLNKQELLEMYKMILESLFKEQKKFFQLVNYDEIENEMIQSANKFLADMFHLFAVNTDFAIVKMIDIEKIPSIILNFAQWSRVPMGSDLLFQDRMVNFQNEIKSLLHRKKYSEELSKSTYVNLLLIKSKLDEMP
jgi:hypothetical protein